MAQEPPPRPPTSSTPKPSLDLSKLDFDPQRLKLPQAAIVGFAIGIFFHACVVFAVLDDGSSAGSNGNNGPTGETEQQQEVDVPSVTPTLDPRAARTDCNAIRTTGDYRSGAQRSRL